MVLCNDEQVRIYHLNIFCSFKILLNTLSQISNKYKIFMMYFENFKKNLITISPIIFLNLTAISSAPLYILLFIFTLVLNISRLYVLLAVYFIASISSDYFINSLMGGGSVLLIQLAFAVSYFLGYWRIRRDHFKDSIVLMLLITIMLLFWTIFSKFDSDFESLISILNIVITVFIMCDACVAKDNIKKMFDLIIFGALITLVFTLNEFVSNFQDWGIVRLTIRHGLNENKSGMILGYIGTIIVFSFFYIKSTVRQLVFVLFSLVCVAAILIIGSRSSLIGLISAFLLAVIFKRKVRVILLIIFIFIFISLFDISSIFNDFGILSRFTYQNIADSNGSSRFDLWMKFIPFIYENNLLFGIGFGPNQMYSLAKFKGWDNVPHNMFVDIFVQLGFLGSLLFISLLLIMFSKNMSRFTAYSKELRLLPLLLFSFSIVTGFGESVFNERFFYNSFLLLGLVRKM
jgi:O-antigen ligase